MNRHHLFPVLVAVAACSGSNDQPEVVNQPYAGYIPVIEYTNGTSAFEYSIEPSFIEATGSDLCTIDTFEPCRIITCPQARAGLAQLSAGLMTVAVGSMTESLPYNVNSYMDVETNGTLFSGGEMISVQASGTTEAVPAFSGTITAPSPISVTAPISNQTLMISQSQPEQITWTGTSAGIVLLQLQQTNTTAQSSVSVECHFDPAAGSGTIPASVLSQIAQGNYEADIFTRTRNELSAGQWSVLLDAQYEAGVQNMGAYKRPAIVGP